VHSVCVCVCVHPYCLHAREGLRCLALSQGLPVPGVWVTLCWLYTHTHTHTHTYLHTHLHTVTITQSHTAKTSPSGEVSESEFACISSSVTIQFHRMVPPKKSLKSHTDNISATVYGYIVIQYVFHHNRQIDYNSMSVISVMMHYSLLIHCEQLILNYIVHIYIYIYSISYHYSESNRLMIHTGARA